MPRDTWLNLPAEKRDHIVEVALVEFGSNGFSAGSLNVVAREAGIAKGSLFQYFDDKLDLFTTVCAVGSNRIAQQTIGTIDPSLPLFDFMRALIVRWMEYFRTEEVDQRLAFAVSHEIDADARAAVRGVANAEYSRALTPMVEQAVARGDVRADVDPALVLSMATLVLRHLNSAPFDPVGDPAFPFTTMDDADVNAIALSYVDALERAFA